MTDEGSPLLHPIEELSALGDADVYVFVRTPGGMTRVHVVKKDGRAFINPPPADGRCECCRRPAGSAPPYSETELRRLVVGLSPSVVEDSGRSVLAKVFQWSEVDGALVAAWLCSECAKLDPSQRHLGF